MRYRPRTALELAVVAVLIGGLATVLASRLRVLQIDAEAAHLRRVVTGIRSALAFETAEWIATGARDDRLLELLSSNPMDSLLVAPPSYVGEVDAPDPYNIEPGSWYFDRRDRVLVYRVQHAGAFDTHLPEPARARFKFVPVYDDRNRNGRFEPARDRFRGIQLVALEPYRFTHRQAEKPQESPHEG